MIFGVAMFFGGIWANDSFWFAGVSSALCETDLRATHIRQSAGVCPVNFYLTFDPCDSRFAYVPIRVVCRGRFLSISSS